MLRVGLNGFGRIGRAILRSNMNKQKFQVVAINDINPDIHNLAYTINYDTLYGSLQDKFFADGNRLGNGSHDILVTHIPHVDEVDWKSHNIDVLIDATGILDNVLRMKSALKKNNIKKGVVTHSPKEVDFTMVLGANHDKLDVTKHDVISSSICDATALGPVMQLLNDKVGIEHGSVTTLHPWLSYQNVLDGPASSWSVPGEIYHHYALGRAVEGNIIPKPTSAINATCKVVEGITEDMIGSFSYRTPTAIVGSADLSLSLGRDVDKDEIMGIFQDFENKQPWKIIKNNLEPLVSLDFKQSEYSAVVDHRWTDVKGKRLLKLVLWYDNEWGYSTRVIDQVDYIAHKVKEAL